MFNQLRKSSETVVASSRELVRSLYDALGQGDLPAALDLLDPQVLWREAENGAYDSGDGWVGPDAVVQNLFANLAQDWTEFTIQPSQFHDAGSVVTVEGRYKASHRQTGKDMDCQFCHVWTIEREKVTKFQQYADTAKMQEVTGVSG